MTKKKATRKIATKGRPITNRLKGRDGRDPVEPGAQGAIRAMKERQDRFIQAFTTAGTVGAACRAIDIHRNTYHAWMSRDPDFVVEMVVAKEEVADMLEAAAIKRATKGVSKNVYHRGEKIGTEITYSDVLLIFMLKGLRPEKYRDNYIPSTTDANMVSITTPERQKVVADETMRNLACQMEEQLCGVG